MEQEFVAELINSLPRQHLLQVPVGDDAAVLGGEQANTVLTTDLLTDGVDFIASEVALDRIGHKALAVNLSDLAAMAATPTAALVALALPSGNSSQVASEIFAGILGLAERFQVTIAGGDTNCWDGPLVISITAVGYTPTPLTRSGGKAGDVLLATGAFGGSILGRHLDVQPRVAEALALRDQFELHAGIDVSDGLSLDVSRLAAASGCGAELELADIPIHADATRLSAEDGVSPLDHALGDGEDFELILAVPPAVAETVIAARLEIPLTRIGKLIAEPGLFAKNERGTRTPLVPRGFEHA